MCARPLRDGDTFTTHHRGHGIFLARGADPNRMMAEIAGKETGYCGGKGGSMHIADMGLGHLGANAIVGGGIPAVVGAGLAAKQTRSGAVSVAFFGDGAMQQGILYESMNMAALWDLPVLFVCINNQWGMGTRVDQATKATALHERALTFGLNGVTVDGLDVVEVRETAQELDRCRARRQAGLSGGELLPALRACTEGQEPLSNGRGRGRRARSGPAGIRPPPPARRRRRGRPNSVAIDTCRRR